MDLDDYRKGYEKEVTTAAARGKRKVGASGASAGERGTRELVAVIKDAARPAGARVTAIDEVGADAVSKPAAMKALLAVLAAPDDDPPVRRAALDALQQNSFSAVAFRRWSTEFLEALRAVATDADPELRARAIDLLALSGDEYVQRLLVEGLEDPAKGLVPTQAALRMIGYDVHGDHYGLLRDIAETSDKPTDRRAALRLLAADSDSSDLFERIAADKSEDSRARATSAIALQSLAPDRFDVVAREVLVDADDDDTVRATFVNALAHGPSAHDEELVAQVRAVEEESSSPQLTQAARHFGRLADEQA